MPSIPLPNDINDLNYSKLFFFYILDQFLKNVNKVPNVNTHNTNRKQQLAEVKNKRGKSGNSIASTSTNAHNDRKTYSSSKNRTNLNHSIVDHSNHQHVKSAVSSNKEISEEQLQNINKKVLEFYREEKYSIIRALWEELAVTDNYKNVFENISSQLEKSYRENYWDFEILNLKKFKENLNKLTNEINLRENSIELLKKLNLILAKETTDDSIGYSNLKNKQKVLDDIKKLFQHLRVLIINIVNHFLKLRKSTFYDITNNKYDLDRLNLNFNYLIKMKNDTDFLYNSNMKKYFNISYGSDPFFVSLNTSLPGYITVPIDDSMLTSIRNCQFIILQDLVYSELSVLNNLNKNETTLSTGKSSKSIYNKPSQLKSIVGKNKNIANHSPDLKHLIKNSDNPISININNINNINNIGNISTTNHLPLESLLNESKITKKSEISIKEKDLKKIEKIINTHKHKEENLKENLIVETNIIRENIKESNKNILPKYRNEKINIDDSRVVTNEIIHNHNNKGEHNTNTNNFTPTIPLLKKMDEVLFTSVSMDEELKKERKELEFLEKEMNERLLNKENEYNKTLEIQKEKVNDLETETKIEKIIEKKTNNNNEDNQDLYKNFGINKLKFSFFTSDISDLINEYSDNYTNKINLTQKETFNIKSNLSEYITGNFVKIIRITYSSQQAGLAILHFEPYNLETSKIKIILSHFSTINQLHDYLYEILTEFLNFLKQTIVFDEMNLEVYFTNNNDNYIMDEYINDIIKKKIKFKWLTLENTGTARKIKYKYLNNDKKVSLNNPNSLLTISNVIIFSTTNNESANHLDSAKQYNAHENEINLFPLGCLYAEMIYENDYYFKNEQFKKLNCEKLKKYSKDFVKCLCGDNTSIIDFVKENQTFMSLGSQFNIEDINEFSEIKKEDMLFTSIMHIDGSFNKILALEINRIKYNRITCEKIDVLKNATNGEIYYLIRSSNENISIIVGEITEKGGLYNLDNKNLTEKFTEIYMVSLYITFRILRKHHWKIKIQFIYPHLKNILLIILIIFKAQKI